MLTPNIVRFIALKLVNQNPNWLTIIGNCLVRFDNSMRAQIRIRGAVMTGLLLSLSNKILTLLPYTIFSR